MLPGSALDVLREAVGALMHELEVLASPRASAHQGSRLGVQAFQGSGFGLGLQARQAAGRRWAPLQAGQFPAAAACRQPAPCSSWRAGDFAIRAWQGRRAPSFCLLSPSTDPVRKHALCSAAAAHPLSAWWQAHCRTGSAAARAQASRPLERLVAQVVLHEYLSFNWKNLDSVYEVNQHLLREDGLMCTWTKSLQARCACCACCACRDRASRHGRRPCRHASLLHLT